MARNAEQILTKSIRDIEDGYWCQGDLGFCPNPDEGIERMACAVGLVSLYGNHTDTTNLGGKTFTYLRYPSEGKAATKSVRVAIEALYFALPKKNQHSKKSFNEAVDFTSDEYSYDYPESATKLRERATLAVMQTAVVDYNDTKTTNQKKAIAWFTKARNSLKGNTFATEATADALADALS